MIDPEDEADVCDEPDDPDAWLDCSEDYDDCLGETLDAEGVPLI